MTVRDYRERVTEGHEQSLALPCEECGAPLVEMLEPVDPLHEDPDVVATGTTHVTSDVCTRIDCPSNLRRPH